MSPGLTKVAGCVDERAVQPHRALRPAASRRRAGWRRRRGPAIWRSARRVRRPSASARRSSARGRDQRLRRSGGRPGRSGTPDATARRGRSRSAGPRSPSITPSGAVALTTAKRPGVAHRLVVRRVHLHRRPPRRCGPAGCPGSSATAWPGWSRGLGCSCSQRVGDASGMCCSSVPPSATASSCCAAADARAPACRAPARRAPARARPRCAPPSA